jgi:hypothetical protein
LSEEPVDIGDDAHAGPDRCTVENAQGSPIAGILFAVLLFVVFWLLRRSVAADPHEPGSWLRRKSEAVALALNLVPFAGIAFLWFIGGLRDRLGKAEDQFFATVFFGSGVLYLCMLFSAAAIIGALILAFAAQPEEFIDSATFHFARAAAYNIVNIYLTKMAAVFMMTTSTVAIYTGLIPRWLVFVGYGSSVLLLFGYYIGWGFVVLITSVSYSDR